MRNSPHIHQCKSVLNSSTSMAPSMSTIHNATASATFRSSKQANKSKSIPKLSSLLADPGLAISKANGKKKTTALFQSDEQRRLVAMQSVNSASQSLSALVQSDWKRRSELPPNKKSSTQASANASAASAAKHLSTLREISPGDLDVERAASSVVGKLIALEMVWPISFSLFSPE